MNAQFILPFRGRNPSATYDSNVLWRFGSAYIMDNHGAALWCWLQHIDNVSKYELLHIDQLQKSIDTLSRQKLRDIATQYSAQWPRIDAFANAIIASLTDTFGQEKIGREDFLSAITQQFQSPGTPLCELRGQESWIYTALWASPSIEEKLFLIGCIGYVQAGERFYPWAGRSLEKFRLANSYFVSPLFVFRH